MMKISLQRKMAYRRHGECRNKGNNTFQNNMKLGVVGKGRDRMSAILQSRCVRSGRETEMEKVKSGT